MAVELYFFQPLGTNSGRVFLTLLEKGVAETVYPKEGGENVAKYLNDCIEAEIPFYCCTASMELHDLKPEDLIEHVKFVGGATMWELADDSGKVLTF